MTDRKLIWPQMGKGGMPTIILYSLIYLFFINVFLRALFFKPIKIVLNYFLMQICFGINFILLNFLLDLTMRLTVFLANWKRNFYFDDSDVVVYCRAVIFLVRSNVGAVHCHDQFICLENFFVRGAEHQRHPSRFITVSAKIFNLVINVKMTK